MQHCPSPACPYLARHGVASECADTATACPDCGGPLVPGEAPARDPVVTEPVGPVPRALWLRLGVTLFAAAVVAGLGHVGLGELAGIGPLWGLSPMPYGLIALGITPFVSSYAIVELVAVLVPALRRRRLGGRAARVPLRLAADLLGMALAMLQAWALTWELTARVYYSPGFDVPMAPLLISFFAGALLLRVLWGALDGVGLLSGAALLLLTGSVLAVVDEIVGVVTAPALDPQQFVLAPLLPMALTALAVALLLRPPRAVAARIGLADTPLSLPTSGVSPVSDLAAFVSIAVLTANVVGYDLAGGTVLDIGSGSAASIALLGALVALDSWLFQRPRRVARLVVALAGGASDEAALRRRIAMQLALGAAITFGVLLAVALVDGAPGPIAGYGASGIGIVGTAIVVAGALDLGASWRMRRGHGALVRVRELHRVYAVKPVLAALEGAGVPAHAAGRSMRALFPFFGSALPIWIEVPSGDEERARAALRGRITSNDPLAPNVVGVFE